MTVIIKLEFLKVFSWRGISFPSDRLTIGQLRAAHPVAFDDGIASTQRVPFFSLGNRKGNAGDVLGKLLTSERMLFENRCRRDEKPGDENVVCHADAHRSYLLKEYPRLGIAQGEHEARELIRGIESQAERFSHIHMR